MKKVTFKKDKNAGQPTYYSSNGFEIYNRDRGEWLIFDLKQPEGEQFDVMESSLAKAKALVTSYGHEE